MKRRLFTIFIIALMGFSPLLISLSSTSRANNIYSNLADSTDLPIRDLKKGDLVFCDVKPIISQTANNNGNNRIYSAKGYSNDHVLMYIGNNRFIESCPYFYNPLKSDWIGVVITPLIVLKVWATNFTYGRVATTQEIKNDAIRWAKTQRGTPYGTNGYYCGELISNAYNNAGIKLTVTYWDGYTYEAREPTGLKSSNNVTMLSPNEPPVAIMTIDNSGMFDYPVSFYGWESYDIDGRIINWTWDFGDETIDYDPYTTHKYSEPGKYTVTLTIIDNRGDSSTVSRNIELFGDIPEIPDDDNNSDEENNSEDDENNPEDTITNDADKIKENGNSFLGIIILGAIIGIIILLLIALFWILRK